MPPKHVMTWLKKNFSPGMWKFQLEKYYGKQGAEWHRALSSLGGSNHKLLPVSAEEEAERMEARRLW